MYFVTSVFSFFSRGGVASMVRAGVKAIARVFKTSPVTQDQPRGAASASEREVNATEEDRDAENVEENTAADQEVGSKNAHEGDDDAASLDVADNGNETGNGDVRDNEEDGDCGLTPASSGCVDATAASTTMLKTVETHAAEASAIYAFLCMLDLADVRLKRVLGEKATLETEFDELRRRVETADDASAEQIKRLETELQQSRAREYDLHMQLHRQTDLTELRSAEVKSTLDSTRSQYEWLLKTTKAANTELKEKTLRLKLRVADLEADLEEATTRPNEDVRFLLSRAGELELQLEAAYAQLNDKAERDLECPAATDLLRDLETANARLKEQEEAHAFRVMELETALEMANKQLKEAAELREFREIEFQIELEAATSQAAPASATATAAIPKTVATVVQATQSPTTAVHIKAG